MTPTALLALFRAEVRDAVAPYLWSDVEGWSYMDDAQKMFCRLTDGIPDATTTAVVDITVAAAASWLNLHASILKIRGATRTSDGGELTILNYEDMAGRGMRFDGTTGPLSTLISGMEENKVRLGQVASEADAIKLLVFRLPINEINATTVAAAVALEIPAEHHRHLLSWMKHLAHMKQDAETYDKGKADEFEATFRRYCDDAKLEQARKRHKVRTVAYGGL